MHELTMAEGWGRAVVERLSADLQREFPVVAGFSVGNIWRMRAFYVAWTEEVLAQAARETAKGRLAQAARELDGCSLPSIEALEKEFDAGSRKGPTKSRKG